MADPEDLLRRQAEWQKSLARLPWPEKLRMAARLREAVMALRRTKPTRPVEEDASGGPTPGNSDTGSTRR
jgi:hypothetical protein